MTNTYRTRAAFSFKGSWRWVTWNHNEGNSHAAILTKKTELGADGCDFGNSDHAELSRWNHTRG
jgi:hypothetical protein